MRNINWYTVTVKTPYNSIRKIILSGKTKLSSLAEVILDSYGIVKDRAYFYFTGDTPWEGMIYTDTAEFPKYLSAFSVPFSVLAEEDERFVFQIGYDPEFVFDCFIAPSDRTGEPHPTVIYSKGGNVSEFLPVDEDEYYFDGDDVGDDGEEESYLWHEYTETDITVDRYLRSFVSLYGIIPKTKAVEIILLCEPNLSLKEVRRSMRYLPMPDSQKEYIVSGREIMYVELFEMQTGEYFALKKVQRGKNYYVPEREELLRYSDPLYFERTEAYRNLESSVGKNTAEDIYRMLAGGLSPEEALRTEEKILKTPSFDDEVMDLVRDVNRYIRRWENRGFSEIG